MMKSTETGKYRYRPVLFFVLTYLCTWLFWIPAIFVPEDTGALLMVLGLIAPAVVSTLFVLLSGSAARIQRTLSAQDIVPSILMYHDMF